MNTKKLTITALLISFAIMIPSVVFLKVIIPPFSATLGSHVPMFLSMFLGPEVAALVGIGSCIGFFISLGPVVAARAFMHILIGIIGAKLLQKKISFRKVIIITAPIHGLLECLIVLPFVGVNIYNLLIITGIGTILHHSIDGVISSAILKVLEKSKINILNQQKETD
ncbi:ECF transporter S component [Garciella nitratireducens]|uniref:Niacin transporter n=2 Tax=Garciella TaxID=218204 RepID=A0A1T4KPG0_9FIRM|nr:ECF transporter S component [Garciella nitratireducens]RBP40266.1 niacin transporter [Garciella nitratireducens]SJZ44248.1 niacin transporter [Garciella nitratireducens DSM 15102]